MIGLLDFANKWVEKGGLAVLAIIVFAESGLLIVTLEPPMFTMPES